MASLNKIGSGILGLLLVFSSVSFAQSSEVARPRSGTEESSRQMTPEEMMRFFGEKDPEVLKLKAKCVKSLSDAEDLYPETLGSSHTEKKRDSALNAFRTQSLKRKFAGLGPWLIDHLNPKEAPPKYLNAAKLEALRGPMCACVGIDKKLTYFIQTAQEDIIQSKQIRLDESGPTVPQQERKIRGLNKDDLSCPNS